MGFDVTDPVTEEQIDRSQRWIHDSQKRFFERSLCQLFGYLGGQAATQLVAQGIQRHDGIDGFVTIDVGFLHTSGPVMYPEVKLRTMVPGASTLRESPFEHTSFLAGRGKDDPRVLTSRLARMLRRSGLDELPQPVYQVPAGEMLLVGARGYTEPELKGTEILIELSKNPHLRLPQAARELLETYQRKVDRYNPKPSFTGLLQATTTKETPHLVRMLGDIICWERSTPATDFRIALYTLRRRFEGVGAW